MRYTTKTPVHEVDLDLDESERWADVLEAERAACRKFARSAKRGLDPHKSYVNWFGPAFEMAYKLFGGRYIGEVKSLSEAMALSSAEGFVLNCQYELTHATNWFNNVNWPKMPWPLGCTAGIRWIPHLGMVHARSMDWELPGIGDATRIIWFRRGKRRFASVHILGFVGVLSGILPKRYSATINWLPAQRRPTFDFGPAFLLREVFEECDSFREAVSMLRTTTVSTAVSFTVCGAREGEACVIEHTGSDVAVRKIKDKPLIQGNQFNSTRLWECNECILEPSEEDCLSMFEDSSRRQNALFRRLEALSDSASLKEVSSCLAKSPVRVPDSFQQMVFCPTSGDFIVLRKLLN